MLLELAYRPFLDPLPAQSLWYLFLVPLALGISVVYKAVRVGDMKHFQRAVAVMTAQVILGIIGLAALAFVLFIVIAPRLIPPVI